MTKDIKIQGDIYRCELVCTDAYNHNPIFELTTITRGKTNKYFVKTKVIGIEDCTEDGLHFGVASTYCMNEVDDSGEMYSNEYTLLDEYVSDLFYDLTTEKQY